MRIYTRKGDRGTTGLLYGGERVPKSHPRTEAYGTTDEAVSALGLARAALADDPLADLIVRLQRELFVVGAELATHLDRREKLTAGVTMVAEPMVTALEGDIDRLEDQHPMPKEFVLPGESLGGAALDLARSTVRRAERAAVALDSARELPNSFVIPYLNRLADLLFVMARVADRGFRPVRTDAPLDAVNPEPADEPAVEQPAAPESQAAAASRGPVSAQPPERAEPSPARPPTPVATAPGPTPPAANPSGDGSARRETAAPVNVGGGSQAARKAPDPSPTRPPAASSEERTSPAATSAQFPAGRTAPLDEATAQQAFREAVALFNQARYWHAHEGWETLWRAADEKDRNFYQGLIQIAAGLLHLQRRNSRGATNKLSEGIEKLRPYEPKYRGIVVDELVARADRILGDLQAGGRPYLIPPVIRFVD